MRMRAIALVILLVIAFLGAASPIQTASSQYEGLSALWNSHVRAFSVNSGNYNVANIDMLEYVNGILIKVSKSLLNHTLIERSIVGESIGLLVKVRDDFNTVNSLRKLNAILLNNNVTIVKEYRIVPIIYLRVPLSNYVKLLWELADESAVERIWLDNVVSQGTIVKSHNTMLATRFTVHVDVIMLSTNNSPKNSTRVFLSNILDEIEDYSMKLRLDEEEEFYILVLRIPESLVEEESPINLLIRKTSSHKNFIALLEVVPENTINSNNHFTSGYFNVNTSRIQLLVNTITNLLAYHPNWDLEAMKNALTLSLIDLKEHYKISRIIGMFNETIVISTISRERMENMLDLDIIPSQTFLDYESLSPGEIKTIIVKFKNYNKSCTYVLSIGSPRILLKENCWKICPWLKANTTQLTIPPCSSRTVAFTINTTNIHLRGSFIGEIPFKYNNSVCEDYKIVFKLDIPEYVEISGRVTNVLSGAPIRGVNVYAVDARTGKTYWWNITDNDGHYSLLVENNTYVYIIGSKDGYYCYVSKMIHVENSTLLDFKITPEFGHYPLQVLLVLDDDNGFFVDSIRRSIFTSINGTEGIIIREWSKRSQGIPLHPILSGDFPAVIWSTSLVHSGAVDPEDTRVLMRYVGLSYGGVLIEGEDIGWDHKEDEFYRYVCRAKWITGNTMNRDLIVACPNHPIARSLPQHFALTKLPPCPDGVVPANGGVSIVNYSSGLSAIIAYNGSMHFSKVFDKTIYYNGKTVYIAFPMSYLPEEICNQLLLDIVKWLLDASPPITPPSATANILQERERWIISLKWPRTIDPPFNASVDYTVSIDSSPWEKLSNNEISYNITATGVHNIIIRPIDVYGNIGSSLRVEIYIPEGRSVEKAYVKYYGTPGFYEENYSDIRVIVRSKILQPARTIVQIGESPRPLSSDVRSLDLYISNPYSIEMIEVKIKYYDFEARYVNEKTIRPLWWNGFKWVKVTKYIVDPDNNTVIMYVDASTTPSLKQLRGARIVLRGKSFVGGEITGSIVVSSSRDLREDVGLIMIVTAIVCTIALLNKDMKYK